MRQNILIFLFLIAFTAIVAQTNKLSNEKQANPTLMKNASFVGTPRYQYYLVYTSHPSSYYSGIDTLFAIVFELGKTKSVDDADRLKLVGNRILARLGNGMRLDSIPIPQPSKPNNYKPGK